MSKTWDVVVAALVSIVMTACSGGSGSTPGPEVASRSAAVSTSAVPSPTGQQLDDIPPEARVSDGGGDPRPIAYWAVWNSCAPDNRAAEAAENGGPEAGFFLVDDLLANPGLQLGDYRLVTCEDGLRILLVHRAGGSRAVSQMAAQLLTAELNLNVGAESCPAIEETAVGAHVLLSAIGYDDEGASLAGAPSDVVDALPRFVRLLAAYNSGELCI